MASRRSESFRLKQRIHQIDEEKNCRYACDDVFHGNLLKAIRSFCETPHQGEEHNHHGYIKQIQHVHLTRAHIT
jgi:hypothetical protein